MNLNLDDIDWERQKIRVNKGKGDNYSTINIHPDALNALRRYLQVRRQPKKEHEEWDALKILCFHSNGVCC